jgi:hypothetical protein
MGRPIGGWLIGAALALFVLLIPAPAADLAATPIGAVSLVRSVALQHADAAVLPEHHETVRAGAHAIPAVHADRVSTPDFGAEFGVGPSFLHGSHTLIAPAPARAPPVDVV